MPHDSITVEDVDLDDWEVLQKGWWQTTLGVPAWSYPDERRTAHHSPRTALKKRPHPPPYHNNILRALGFRPGLAICCVTCQEVRDRLCPCDASRATGDHDGVDLSGDLIGVRVAQGVVEQYEQDVGFSAAAGDTFEPGTDIATLARRVSLLLGDSRTSNVAQDRWADMAEALFGGLLVRLNQKVFLEAIASGAENAGNVPSILDLDLSAHRLKEERHREAVDLTDSEQSVESEPPPATPKPRQMYADSVRAVSDGTSEKRCMEHVGIHTTRSPSPDQFVLPRAPSSPSTSSLSPQTSEDLLSESSHTSHTRSNSLPNVSLRKDDQGFYVPVPEDSSIVLPHFLLNGSGRTRRPHSRTREIIDRLRCTGPSKGRHGTAKALAKSEECQGASAPSKVARQLTSREAVAVNVRRMFQKGSDGWIRMSGDEEEKAPATTTKGAAPRRGDGFMNFAEDTDTEDVTAHFATLLPAPVAPLKKKGGATNKQKHNRRTSGNDGWKDTSRADAQHSGSWPAGFHHQVPLTAPASVGTFTFPLPPTSASSNPYPGMYPGPGYPAMPPFHGALPASQPFAQTSYTAPPFAMYNGLVPYPVVMVPVPYMQGGVPPTGLNPSPRPGASNGAITGAAGMRHVQW